jgi:site-specific DNA recombinase
MKDELLALEARKVELAVVVKQAPGPAPRLHPRLADIYRDKVERLRDSLNAESTRAEAAEALRGLIEEIRLVPEEGQLQIELAGDLAGILALAAGSRKPVTADRDGLQVTLVAGTRNHLYRTHFHHRR